MHSLHHSFLYVLSFSLPRMAEINVPILSRAQGSKVAYVRTPVAGRQQSFSKVTTGRSRAEVEFGSVTLVPKPIFSPCQQFLHIKVNNFSFVSFNYHYNKTLFKISGSLQVEGGPESRCEQDGVTEGSVFKSWLRHLLDAWIWISHLAILNSWLPPLSNGLNGHTVKGCGEELRGSSMVLVEAMPARFFSALPRHQVVLSSLYHINSINLHNNPWQAGGWGDSTKKLKAYQEYSELHFGFHSLPTKPTTFSCSWLVRMTEMGMWLIPPSGPAQSPLQGSAGKQCPLARLLLP